MAVFLLSLLIGSALALQGGTLLTILGTALLFSALIIHALLIQVGAWSVFWTILLDILAFNFGFIAMLGARFSWGDSWRS